jgi:hypothetical protein
MCDEMMVSFAQNIDNSHITEMDKRQGKHYSAGHAGNAACQLGKAGHRLPVPYHHCSITKVQKVVAGQQHFVNEISQFFLAFQQRNKVQPAIAVEKPTSAYGDEVSNKEIDDVCQRVHDGVFYHFAFDITKLVNIFVFSNISENIIF